MRVITIISGIIPFFCVLILFLLISHSWAHPILQSDRLLTKFKDGTQLIRSMTESEVMLVNIESIDSLSVNHEVFQYKKLEGDYPETSPYAMYYRVVFHDSKQNIEEIREEFENDYHVEFAKLEYENDELYLEEWIPKDFFFAFAPRDEWLCEGPQYCDGTHVTEWGNAFVEQWPLKNDADIYVNECNPSPEPCSLSEDINADSAWGYYFERTPEDTLYDIPGDPNVVIGHMNTGIYFKNPEITAALRYDPEEDHAELGQFKHDKWWNDPEEPGDMGSPSGGWRVGEDQPDIWNGVPGDLGDDDEDTFADWNDPGIREIISNHKSDDDDDWYYDEPRANPPPDWKCDCPHTLVGIVDPSDPDGDSFDADDLGDEGQDDDNDGFIDECDGAMWDDNENGYVDDVVGWSFWRDNNYPEDVVDNDYHGSQTFGYSVANANNPVLQEAPQDATVNIPKQYLRSWSFPV